jgi:hypothetical protein
VLPLLAFGLGPAALASAGLFLLLLAGEDLADFGGKALAYPAVVHGLDGGETLFRVPF